jgi:ankyrin repeat protein
MWKEPHSLPNGAVRRPCIDLLVAIHGGDIECIKRLLDGGANPNFVNKDYETSSLH